MPRLATTCRTRFSEITQDCDLLSVNRGVPVDQALHRAGHLLGAISAELAQCAMGEPMTAETAFLLLSAAETAHALVVACAEGASQ